MIIPALSDIGDRAALPLILGAAQSGAAGVRIPAIEALQRFHDPAAISVLLEAAVEQDAEVAQAAHATLSALDSGEINAAIARLLGGDEPRTLEVAIQLAGRRGIASATPALLQLSNHPDAQVRRSRQVVRRHDRAGRPDKVDRPGSRPAASRPAVRRSRR